jgi:hypothetical protein
VNYDYCVLDATLTNYALHSVRVNNLRDAPAMR